MKSKKILAALLALTLGLSVFAGCKKTTTEPSTADTPKAYSGLKIIDVSLPSEPQTLDAQKMYGAPDLTVANMFIEGLTRYSKEEGKYDPGVAKSWKFDSTTNTWSFELRKDAKWADGAPVTAQDFFTAWKIALDDQVPYKDMLQINIVGADAYASLTKKGFLASKDSSFKALVDQRAKETDADKKKDLNGKINDALAKMSESLAAEFKKQKDDLWSKVGVKQVNDSIEIKLAVSCPYFLALTSFPVFYPMNEKFYNDHKKAGDYTLEASGLYSNGPWIMKEWKHNDSFTLEKNKNYWNKDAIKIDKVNIKIVDNVSTRTNLLKAGDLDAAGIQGDDLAIFQDKATRDQYHLQDLQDMPDYTVFYLEFNHFNNPLTMNENFRKAIAYALDNKGLTEKVSPGDMAAQALIPEYFLGYKKPFREEAGKALYEGRNVQKAKDFLKKALEELKIDKLPTQDLLMDDDDVAKKHGEKMQSDLREVGIDVRLVPLPWGEKLTRLQNGEFGIMSSGWGPDYLDPSTYLDLFESTNSNNNGQYNNPEFDKLVQAARTEKDLSKRMEYFYKAEKILIDHMVIAPRYFRIAHYAPKDYLTGVVLRGSGAPTDYYWADIDMAKKMELKKK